MPSNFLDNPLVRYLEEGTPEAIIRAGLPAGASLGMQNFASSYAPLALNQFQSAMAQKTLRGEPADDMFTDWWGKNVSAPWLKSPLKGSFPAADPRDTPPQAGPYVPSDRPPSDSIEQIPGGWNMETMQKGLNRAYRRFGQRTPVGLTGPIGRTY